MAAIEYMIAYGSKIKDKTTDEIPVYLSLFECEKLIKRLNKATLNSC